MNQEQKDNLIQSAKAHLVDVVGELEMQGIEVSEEAMVEESVLSVAQDEGIKLTKKEIKELIQAVV